MKTKLSVPKPTIKSMPAAIDAAITAMHDKVFPVRLDRMLESLRYAEYDMAHGIAEAVDNSTEAGASDIWVDTQNEEKASGSKTIEVISKVAITDNGEGMSEDVLQRCLVLGESLRAPKPGNRKGIGRFGVGMTLGAISLGRRVEVYSRTTPDEPFLYTYIDLDEIGKKEQVFIPKPEPKDPPLKFQKKLAKSSGTVIIISKCDRLQIAEVTDDKPVPASEHMKPLMVYLGRTYRKFIDAGRRFWLNDEKVYLHDPLYVMGPTFPESKAGKPDPKAEDKGTDEIELSIPGKPAETAKVKLKLTLLPKEWRSVKNAGASPLAKERKIPENEGVSILRAEREVLYGSVPYILGVKGQARSLEIDRWWGLEISFPPELDDYFHVRYIKRGAEPIVSLRDSIRGKIAKAVEEMRKTIQKDLRGSDPATQNKQQGVFADAEASMAEAAAKLSSSKRGSNKTEAQADEELNLVAQADVSAPTPEEKEKKKEELKKKPFSIVPVTYPKNVLFDTEHILGRIIVKLNVEHPFYKDVFEPLCGTVASMTEDSDLMQGAETEQKIATRKALLLLILSYAKAESTFEGNEEVLENLRSQWGISLATALKS